MRRSFGLDGEMAFGTVAERIGSVFSRRRAPLISPEEAALRLLPFLLSTERVPVGVRLICTKVWTPATIAFEEAGDYLRMAALSAIQRQGIITYVAQVLNVDVAGVPIELTFRLLAMNSNAAAHRFVDAGVYPFNTLQYRVDCDAHPAPLGDRRRIYRLTGLPGIAVDVNRCIDIRWRRGALALRLRCNASNQARESMMLSIAAWIDQRLAVQPPLVLTEPTTLPPASERTRLRALLRLAAITIPASALPHGYAVTAEPRAGNVAWHAIDAVDPLARVLQLDDEFQLLINVQRGYSHSEDATAPRIITGLSESASDAGAMRQMANEASVSGVVTWLPAPDGLGDERAACRTVHGDERGVWSDSLGIYWRHGRVMLAVSVVGMASEPPLADALRCADALERAYQRSVYARPGSFDA